MATDETLPEHMMLEISAFIIIIYISVLQR